MQKASVYRGIEYIRISELPEVQRVQIRNWLNNEVVIKIRTANELMADCITYSDYTQWFENIFTQLSPVEETVLNTTKQVKPVSGWAFKS